MVVRVVRQRRCRGSSLVEASLITIVLLTILLTIVNSGYVLFEHETLLYQARTAARYGAVNPVNVTGVQNIVRYGQPGSPADNRPAMFGLTADMVSVDRRNAGTSEDHLSITISNYDYILVLPFLAGAFKGKPIQVSVPVEQ